VKGSKQIRA